ncbi:uncharacterized protein H6S33_007968 [Morchella sextelata]|uniref:uncharacterized protein n=1 Tax=Morchella sextelata TaxID=1174677 RepID=UPI001D056BF3|nr:uncharacterized protein H6S33_007968 [Morchella sextelata]KAH0602964.1 hypothetical protein H6S33_007968 [Morchella sextelata]
MVDIQMVCEDDVTKLRPKFPGSWLTADVGIQAAANQIQVTAEVTEAWRTGITVQIPPNMLDFYIRILGLSEVAGRVFSIFTMIKTKIQEQ